MRAYHRDKTSSAIYFLREPLPPKMFMAREIIIFRINLFLL
ncbi:hypothetical protein HMPREF0454_02248 [Hafnia alvei ATCC 51873]|uniref:Uncharacterized protein n=1 Tax=Hafnia alvei ATCC 51873 TaxID=1002364 RepID=G9Y6G5_HAFAL|nr:hypothetical protein HMPREF0454_02248 [Hafnia alvei ATCC 51873]